MDAGFELLKFHEEKDFQCKEQQDDLARGTFSDLIPHCISQRSPDKVNRR
jgi:hypothetical protein